MKTNLTHRNHLIDKAQSNDKLIQSLTLLFLKKGRLRALQVINIRAID